MEKNQNKKKSNLIKVHDTTCEIMKVLEGEKGCEIIVGNNIISKKIFKTKKDAFTYINSKPYELITNLCAILIEKMAENIINNQNKKEEQKNEGNNRR